MAGDLSSALKPNYTLMLSWYMKSLSQEVLHFFIKRDRENGTEQLSMRQWEGITDIQFPGPPLRFFSAY